MIIVTNPEKARYNRIALFYHFLDVIPELIFKPWRKMLLVKTKGKILEIGGGLREEFPPTTPREPCITGIDICD